MADTFYYLSGKVSWAKILKPDEKYECYSIDLHLSDEAFQMFKDSGLQLKVHEDNEKGDWIRLRRPMTKKSKNGLVDMGPPQVLLKRDGDYVPFSQAIGNGSEVIAKVRVYDTARGKGHELSVVAIEELIEYNATESIGGEDLPF
jgi:hypothetical protein